MKWICLVVAAFAIYFAVLFSLSRPSPAATKALWFTGSATPQPTNTPVIPNIGAFYMVTAGTQNVPASNSPIWPHVSGIFFGLSWAFVEPGGTSQAACAANPAPSNCFDWTDTVDPILAKLPAGKTAQIVITVGAYGSPMNANACTRFNGAPSPSCAGWLGAAGATGVTVHSDQGPNGASGGFTAGTTLIDPDPGNSVYQAAWEGLVHGFETKYSGDTRIALVSITPMSGIGGNLSLMISASPPCVPPTNPPTTCIEYYNQAWNTITGSGGSKTAFENYISAAGNTLWDYEKNTLTFAIPLWDSPNAFPDVSQSTGQVDNAPRTNIFFHANNNQPAAPNLYSIVNEALQDSLSWSNAVNSVNGVCINGTCSATAKQLGAQMARSEVDKACSTPNGVVLTPACIAQGCSNIVTAVGFYGVPHGLNWDEIYNPDVTNCSTDSITTCNGVPVAAESSMACVSSLLGGP